VFNLEGAWLVFFKNFETKEIDYRIFSDKEYFLKFLTHLEKMMRGGVIYDVICLVPSMGKTHMPYKLVLKEE